MTSSEEEIGGYLGMELPPPQRHLHNTRYRLRSGRASLSLILREVKPRLVHLPYYICPVVLEPLKENNVKWKYYRISRKMEMAERIRLNHDEMLMYVDYYGIKGDYVRRLESMYREKLIIDATQSFYRIPEGASWLFNSARKYFGVPDGSYLYSPEGTEIASYDNMEVNKEIIYSHLVARVNGETQKGYDDFLLNERIQGGKARKMSAISERILSCINYDYSAEMRINNYIYLDKYYKSMNDYKARLMLGDVPLAYPLLLNIHVEKLRLAESKLFVPTMWPGIVEHLPADAVFENRLVTELMPLPIDQRYRAWHMDTIIDRIKQEINN